MLKFLLWLLLLVLCWPLAILAVLLWPLVWLVLLPCRLIGIAMVQRWYPRKLSVPTQSRQYRHRVRSHE